MNPDLRHAAGIIIKDKKILLLKRSAIEEQPNKWCPVNETIKPGETPEQAAARGVKEELGVDFQNLKFLFDNAGVDKTATVFLGDIAGEIKLDPKEVAETAWLTFEEAMKLEYAYGYDKVLERLHEMDLL
ncbi:MAG: NUDIX hydrolase [archaeon]